MITNNTVVEVCPTWGYGVMGLYGGADSGVEVMSDDDFFMRDEYGLSMTPWKKLYYVFVLIFPFLCPSISAGPSSFFA